MSTIHGVLAQFANQLTNELGKPHPATMLKLLKQAHIEVSTNVAQNT